jgi:hypothetical protein
MKKGIYIAAIACLIGSTSIYAGNFSSKNEIISLQQQKEKKKKLNEDELPLVIKNMLKGNEYKDWKLDQAYLIEGTSEYYKIELKKDDQKQTLNLDKYGNKVSVLES